MYRNIRWVVLSMSACVALGLLWGWLAGASGLIRSDAVTALGAPVVLINELDSDTPGTDEAEFIELFDGGAGYTSLDGLVIVFYNGSNDLSYRAIDLDGYSTNQYGFFVLGNAGVPNVAVTFPNNTLQNGADAVALYAGNATDFPNNTPVTLTNLLDAVVYDTSDPDDPGLLVLLNSGQPQVNEDVGGQGTLQSIRRCPDGSGGSRNTSTYRAGTPSPGMFNCPPIVTKEAPPIVLPGALYTYTIQVLNTLPYTLTSLVITDVVPANTNFVGAGQGGTLSNGVVSWNLAFLPPAGNPPSTGLAQVTFQVNAPQTAGVVIHNDRYGMSAANFRMTIVGADVPTEVTNAPITPIRTIQGAAHLSPLMNQSVTYVYGIVTALRSNGFYMQDPLPDSDPATSEAIFVFTSSAPSVAVGDAVMVDGIVQEYRPGGTGGLDNLTITELASPIVRKISANNPLPEAVIIGRGGRLLPDTVIEDDAAGDVETSGVFDPATDGIDFYESLEGMRVMIYNPVAIGATDSNGEIPILVDGGLDASLRTPRGGIVVRQNDFNPERIIVDDAIVSSEPKVRTGTQFNGPLAGVIDYSFGNFKLLNTTPFPAASSGGVISETTSLVRTAEHLNVATMNLENLDALDPQIKFDLLAREIVVNLDSPDLIAVEEVQDNNGAVNDGTVAANLTLSKLILTIQAFGGPLYDYRQIDPVNNQDGGEPGGNIRQGFLFRTDRGLAFVDRPGATATTANAALIGAHGVQLAYSPGRIDPSNPAFTNSRKPLVGEFTFNNRRLFVIVNHFTSKGGDDSLFGRYQPPKLSSEATRILQAQVVNQFVDSILALDSRANIIVLGDMNDFVFSAPLQALSDGVLTNLVGSLPAEEQYTYIYEGNSQTLDHILISAGLFNGGAAAVDIVHMNAEFLETERPTDHDPVLARFIFPSLDFKIFLPTAWR